MGGGGLLNKVPVGGTDRLELAYTSFSFGPGQ